MKIQFIAPIHGNHALKSAVTGRIGDPVIKSSYSFVLEGNNTYDVLGHSETKIL